MRSATNQPPADAEGHFQTNVVANGPALLGYFARRISKREDAADLVSEVFVTAWRRVEDVPSDPEASLRWLYSLARGAVANYRRGETRRTQLTTRLREAVRVSAPASDHAFHEAMELLTRVSDADRELLMLVHWEGLTLQEAAEVLGIKPATARKRAERARHRIAASLPPRSHTQGDQSSRAPVASRST
jgi:RNA polymerase sigma-70 factor (ECF subfamily)